MIDQKLTALQNSCDQVAEENVARIFHENVEYPRHRVYIFARKP
jgi:hypothetical protein